MTLYDFRHSQDASKGLVHVIVIVTITTSSSR